MILHRAAAPRPVRIGLALVVAVYLAYSAFGIAAPFYWGHHGYHGATYMLRARTSLRQHLVSPATWTGFDRPAGNSLYFHHPIGYHHLLTATVPIFGEHEWLPRALAALGGLAALYALYRLVALCWCAWLGLASVAVYVSLPIVCSFSVLSDPMLLELACVLWGLRAYLEYLEQPSDRLLVEAALSYAMGGLLMWEVFFIGPFIAVHALCYAHTARGRAMAPSYRGLHPTTIHTLVIGAACVAVMGFHIGFTASSGVWGEFVASYKQRHTAPSGAYVLDRHTLWMELLYGPAPLVVGAVWFCVFLYRVVAGRTRVRDLAPLTFLYVNSLYIYLFAEGSSVHMYRVFFYSGFFALATIDLADSIGSFAGRVRPGTRALAMGAFFALYLVADLPQAAHNLVESRVLMGTHGEARYDSHGDAWTFAKEVTLRTQPQERVILHFPSMSARKELWYYLDRSLDEVTSLAQVGTYKNEFDHAVLVYDDRAIAPYERAIAENLMKSHPVHFFDRFVLIDLRVAGARVDGYTFDKGPMSLGYRFWVSHVYPPLHVARRAAPAEVCTALRLHLPLAKDEPLTDEGRGPCWADYLRRRAATPGDTIEP